MRSWNAPEPPRLPGTGSVPTIHDQVSGSLRASTTGPTAKLYVCGITPYDATHIGHTATYVAFDLLVRAWRDAGVEVAYVQNVTDIDDPLLERADATGEDWRELAVRQVELFAEDMASLRVLPPNRFVGAVEAMPLIIRSVQQLRERDVTYELDGDHYMAAERAPGFGRISGWSREEMLAVYADRGGDPDRSGKSDPLDWMVWRTERPGEPSWDGGVLGPGRPGWHIECASISREFLGFPVDVQGGGSDLIFPHHEMGAAESAVLAPQSTAAQIYAYQGMVGLDGEKMSKSKGNLVFSSRLRADGIDPMAVRLAVLAHHYRADWEWLPTDIPAAEERLARWRAGVARPSGAAGGPVVDAVRRALSEDLNAPAALTAVDSWAAATVGGEDTDAGAPALVRSACDALLGVAL